MKEGYGQRMSEPSTLPVNLESAAIKTADSLIQDLSDQTNLDTLIHTVNVLSGEDSVTINDSTYLLQSRNPLHQHNDLAADFIWQTLRLYGLQTYNQKYSATGRNIYGIKTGTKFPDQKFIICAHYDCSPAQPPAPGADDNASGTAAVLESARIISRISTLYTVIFAFWDEEEIGHFGSLYFARQASQSNEDILGVINLEMFGWDDNNDGLIDIHTQPVGNSVELAKLVKYLANQYTPELIPVIYNPGTAESDHGSFWKYGYSALVFSEAFYGGDFNPFYQRSDDKIVHFNLAYFHMLSKLAVATISYLAINSIPDALEDHEHNSLLNFSLFQNYPNPFNPSTKIQFQIPNSQFTTLKVYNILGKEVSTLVSKKLNQGNHTYTFDGTTLASGIYYYQLVAGEYREVKKMILLK
jgi:hypothetical protein